MRQKDKVWHDIYRGLWALLVLSAVEEFLHNRDLPLPDLPDAEPEVEDRLLGENELLLGYWKWGTQ